MENRTKSYSIIPCLCIQAQDCFKHSNFFKVNVAYPTHTQLRACEVCAKKANADSGIPTSFLTATTLQYAIGAGITAAAGTRLAFQLVLVKRFKLYSFQLQDYKKALYCYFLSLPPHVRIG